ncbi:MAG: hydrogenase expression/formation C-terminal domain-containing protein [Pseudomonadota bacterium]|jgi:hydrogenase-1 operon protein HyaF|nr:hydrogenase expression/formation protein [Rubrivivax sp.]MCA3258410.1 hydrogenase expression/formation protein [Rubrivivax sp.]MCE2911834.1 hydrogenase expression/formation protein [Rubrivivax sp.]MCZ8031640.1 hydrogenase expression/formation protein [Rubrivivax sp.]
MNPFPIPVRAAPLLGPGSQPDEDAALDVMPLPREMHTFEMPPVPQQAPPGTLEAATELLAGLLRDLRAWDFASGEDGPRVDLRGLPAPVLDIVGQVLGEGEVSIRVDGEQPLRIQETAFAGLWRCCRLDARGVRLHDWIEAGAVPGVVPEAARAGTAAGLAEAPLPPGVMNAPALLAEIGARLSAPDRTAHAHQLNLTLLPMAPEDHVALEQALPVGPVAIISRGFGNCRVTSTGTRDVWRVQYFNNMNTLILNTLEVVGIPEVVVASDDDLEDTIGRLAELVQWMDESAQPPAS